MSDRMLVERWDFDKQTMVDFSFSPLKVQEFIAWLLNTSLWKEYPETLLVDRCMKLRKELLESMTPDIDPLRATNVKKGEGGRFVKRG